LNILITISFPSLSKIITSFKAITSTDQGDKLYIAFEATEGFNPDYTEVKVNGTSVDVSKGTGIRIPKSLLTKKVNEVVILDKDGKEVVLNVFNVNGEGEIPTSPSVTEPDVTSADVTSADVTSADVTSADVTSPDASISRRNNTGFDKTRCNYNINRKGNRNIN